MGICKNCGREKEDHYVSIENRTKKFKNIVLWCFSLNNKQITPKDKRYMMKYTEDSPKP